MKISYIEKIDNNLKYKTIDFFKKNERDFPVPLSKKIDFNQYINKIIQKGNILLAVNNYNIILGCITFYANDLINKTAYISIVCVDKNNRNQGVGKLLLEKVIRTIQNIGMERIVLYTHIENVNAIKLYRSFGFIVVDNDRTPFDIKLVKIL